MLRAGSLFYALAIAAIIALTCSAVLLAAFFNRSAIANDTITEELIRNARSGIEILLAENRTKIELTETDLFKRGMDSVRLEKKNWGAYEIAVSTAHRHGHSYCLTAMTGWQSSPGDQTALVLADLDKPLSVTGNTALRGDCYLPAAGIKRAYIEGESYSGDKLVYGQTYPAERFLPVYNDTLVKQLENLFQFIPGEKDSVIDYAGFQTSDSISNSFLNPVVYVWSAQPIKISMQKISGMVCIISTHSIEVDENSGLKNVLLIAPEIIIKENVHGQFQAFASDSIAVAENVRLEYPSVLGLIAGKNSPERSQIQINSKSLITGQIFACSVANDFRKQVLIRIEKEATVYGTVYSSGLADLQGKIYGDITCVKFELKTNSAVYENHLLHAVIDRNKRSPGFTGSALVKNKNDHKAIVQWLN